MRRNRESIFRMPKRKLALGVFIIIILVLFSAPIFIRARFTAPILMYHFVLPEIDSKNKLEVSLNTFERQMRFLKERHYNVIPLESLAQLIKDKKKMPARTIAITFDDTRKVNYTRAFPLIKKFNFPVTMFIIVAQADQPWRLSWNETRQMRDSGLVDFGSHSLNHPNFLEGISEETLKREIIDSKEIMEEKLNSSINSFSYPFGELNLKIKKIVREAGYKLAVATYPRGHYADNDVYALKRVAIFEGDKNLFFFWLKTTSFYYNYITGIRDKLKSLRDFWKEKILRQGLGELKVDYALL